MILNKQHRKQLLPSSLNWIVLNNLHEFNTKPEMVNAILDRINLIKNHRRVQVNHPMLTFWDYYDTAVNSYYPAHNKFPDVKWMQLAFKEKPIFIEKDTYSIHIYDDLIKYLDQCLLKLDADNTIIQADEISMENAQELIKKLGQYITRNAPQNKTTKEVWLTAYEKHAEEFRGIPTHIPLLDNIIGTLGHKSLAVIGAQTGHGKSTIARTFSYNAAVFGGCCVDYLAFEDSEENTRFDFISLESFYAGYKIPSADMKDSKLNAEQRIQFQQCVDSLTKKLNTSGGYLNLLDSSKVPGTTFQEFKTTLERIAEDRGRPADLIIIDNVDSLVKFATRSYDANTSVNNMVIELDEFCRTYYNNTGTVIILLTQLNKEGINKVNQADEKDSKKTVYLDSTVFRMYPALGHKGVVCLVVYANEAMRYQGTVNIHVVKLRRRAQPTEPIKISANYAFSMIGGEAVIDVSREQKLVKEFREIQRQNVEKTGKVEIDFRDFK